MRTITILSGRYLPGYKDGGPLRTLVNICDCLGQEYQLKIVTNDRDHGDTQAYSNIEYNKPNVVGNAQVWYLKPGGFTFSTILKHVADADVVYCLGPYDDYAYKAMILKRLGKIKAPLVIASMGTFSQGAMKIKSTKKEIFLLGCKLLGLFKNVIWSVTSEIEMKDVQKYIGEKAKCYIAQDLPRAVPDFKPKVSRQQVRGIFLSRICKMKNLSFVLDVLKEIKSQVEFDIYGIIEDKEYWESCKAKFDELPQNITCTYKGEAMPEKVIDIFSEYDFFFLPTLGENYGHVIFEAMSGGCIPVISDQTPWLDLQDKDIGYVLSLNDMQSFVAAIETICELSKDELAQKQLKANEYAKKRYEQNVKNTGYREVFEL